jgi:hypothetical protein
MDEQEVELHLSTVILEGAGNASAVAVAD